jgi:hypothetical protein
MPNVPFLSKPPVIGGKPGVNAASLGLPGGQNLSLISPKPGPTAAQRMQDLAQSAGQVYGTFQQVVSTLSPVGGKLLQFGERVFQAGKFLASFGPGVLESRKSLERFSGIIAQTFANQERQSLLLDMRRAQATAKSVGALGSAVYAFRQNMAPVNIELDKLVNNLARNTTHIASLGAFVVQSSPAFMALRLVNKLAEQQQSWLQQSAAGWDKLFSKISGGQTTFLEDFLKRILGTQQQGTLKDTADFFRKLSLGDFGARAHRPNARPNMPAGGEFPEW